MTDADLMDADCVHGNVWWDCQQCDMVMTMPQPEDHEHPHGGPPGQDKDSPGLGKEDAPGQQKPKPDEPNEPDEETDEPESETKPVDPVEPKD